MEGELLAVEGVGNVEDVDDDEEEEADSDVHENDVSVPGQLLKVVDHLKSSHHDLHVVNHSRVSPDCLSLHRGEWKEMRQETCRNMETSKEEQINQQIAASKSLNRNEKESDEVAFLDQNSLLGCLHFRERKRGKFGGTG